MTEHYDDFDVMMSDDPNGASQARAAREAEALSDEAKLRSSWEISAERVTQVHGREVYYAHKGLVARTEDLTDTERHQFFVDAITDETRIVPDPTKPGFRKTLAELAIERNMYRPKDSE